VCSRTMSQSSRGTMTLKFAPGSESWRSVFESTTSAAEGTATIRATKRTDKRARMGFVGLEEAEMIAHGVLASRPDGAGHRRCCHPVRRRGRHFKPDLRILVSRARGDVKRVIGIVEESKRGTRAESLNQRIEEQQIRKLVASALQEQHRNSHVGKMRGALVGRLPRRVQRESDKDETADSRQWLRGLRLRGHAPAKGFASREQRDSRQEARCGRDGSADGGMGSLVGIRTFRAALQVRKLIPKRG